MRGTTSWRYTNEYGRGKGFESDSLHPLNAKEFMTPLKLTPDANPQAGTHTAYLQWETAPDIVIVECWSEECWGHSDAESKEVPVDTLEIDYTDGGYDTDFIIDLENGNYIYSVIAEWNSAENYSGRAYYSFYTEKEDCK